MQRLNKVYLIYDSYSYVYSGSNRTVIFLRINGEKFVSL